jgi:dephospho-CoA kinase
MIGIGITGGIASGKSTVARLLAGRGVRVVDADLVSHETYAPGTPGYDAVVAAFGTDVIGTDGEIDRSALGRIVFADPSRLKQLSDIVWPATRARVETLQRQAEADGVEAFAVEAVALREAGWRDLFDEVWLVRTPRQAAVERLLDRGLSRGDAELRLDAQAKPSQPDAGDVVIDNDGDLAQLEGLVEAAWQAARTRTR